MACNACFGFCEQDRHFSWGDAPGVWPFLAVSVNLSELPLSSSSCVSACVLGTRRTQPQTMLSRSGQYPSSPDDETGGHSGPVHPANNLREAVSEQDTVAQECARPSKALWALAEPSLSLSRGFGLFPGELDFSCGSAFSRRKARSTQPPTKTQLLSVDRVSLHPCPFLSLQLFSSLPHYPELLC